MRKGEKEGKVCLPTLPFKLISYNLYGCVAWGNLSVLFLFCFLTCWFGSAKRERGNLLRPRGILQLVWKHLSRSQGVMVLCHPPL